MFSWLELIYHMRHCQQWMILGSSWRELVLVIGNVIYMPGRIDLGRNLKLSVIGHIFV